MIVENRWDEKAGLRTGCGIRSQVIDVLKSTDKRRPAMKKVSTIAARPSKKISPKRKAQARSKSRSKAAGRSVRSTRASPRESH
jgi:hypothetical protein